MVAVFSTPVTVFLPGEPEIAGGTLFSFAPLAAGRECHALNRSEDVPPDIIATGAKQILAECCAMPRRD